MITKQCVTIIINGINNVGLLFHLPRFYVEYRLKWQQNLYKIVKFLKTQTNGIGAYDEIQSLSFDTFFFVLVFLIKEYSLMKIDVKKEKDEN